MKPHISLCMIVRNEQENIAACLKGVGGLFGEMIVVDTGSTDATPALARSLGAKVVDFPWRDDFAAARNESRRHAGGDWIFWLDADDRIDAANLGKLDRLFQRVAAAPANPRQAFLMHCQSCYGQMKMGIGFPHPRLFANGSDLAWSGRVHERLEHPDSGKLPDYLSTDIVIQHEGYRDPVRQTRKILRNLRILEQDYLANPDDVWTLFYLGQARHWQERYNDALRLLTRSIRLDASGEIPITPQAYFIAVDCLQKSAQPQAAMQMVQQGLARYPEYVPLLYARGCLLHDGGCLNEAETAFHEVIAASPQRWALAGTWPDLQGERAPAMLGRICHMQGRLAEAETYFLQALAFQPHSVEVLFLLGQVKLSRNCTGDLGEIAARLRECPDGEYHLDVLLAQQCIINRHFAQGKRLLYEAIEIMPERVPAYVALSTLLYREGIDWEQCRAVHEKVLAMDRHQTAIRRRLEQLPSRYVMRGCDLAGLAASPVPLPVAPVNELSCLAAGAGLAFSC